MFGLLRLIIKIGCLTLFVYGVSQLKIENRKISDHARVYILNFLDKHGDKIENKVTKTIKHKLAKYLKAFIAKNLDDDNESHEIRQDYYFSDEPESIMGKIRNKLRPASKSNKKIYSESTIIKKERDMDESKLQQLLGN